MGFVHPDQSRLKIVQRTRSSKHINKNKMAFDPQKDADLMRQKEAIRREKKRIQKLEEENRRRMLRLAQQEIAKKEKKEKREIASFF